VTASAKLASHERVRAAFLNSGISISAWATVNGFSSGLVYQVLEGKRKCVRGQSHRIAIALGLKTGNPMSVAEFSAFLERQKKPQQCADQGGQVM